MAPHPVAAPIAEAVPQEALTSDILALPSEALLVRHGAFSVYRAQATQIPSVLHEIGRLREITFRAVGEGTGKALDLDDYDVWYDHLFVWNDAAQAVAGAYRIGRIDEILAARGVSGVYTASLFHYSPALLGRLSPGLELGRSFVRREHQRNSNVLFLLWKGLGQYVLREPRYRRLVGPVSIDRAYTPSSLQLMVGYLGSRHLRGEDAAHVTPRVPYLPTDADALRWFHVGAQLTDPEALHRAVLSQEADERGVPVLIRQYLRMGSEVLGFNVDPDFSDVVDALMLLDLDRVADERLATFMGKPESVAFRAQRPRWTDAPATGPAV